GVQVARFQASTHTSLPSNLQQSACFRISRNGEAIRYGSVRNRGMCTASYAKMSSYENLACSMTSAGNPGNGMSSSVVSGQQKRPLEKVAVGLNRQRDRQQA